MPDKYIMSWEEVRRRVDRIKKGHDETTVYWGVPRGGQIVAALAGYPRYVTQDPREAHVIVDDIVDSGETREIYLKRFPYKPFYALVDKTSNDHDLGWVEFPWETAEAYGGKADGAQILLRAVQYLGNTEVFNEKELSLIEVIHKRLNTLSNE
jgi:hypothetical protein